MTPLAVLAIVALVFAVKRAFDRIEKLEREVRGFRLKAEEPAPPILPPLPDLPPNRLRQGYGGQEGGSYRVEGESGGRIRVEGKSGGIPEAEGAGVRDETPPPDSRSFRLQAEEAEPESLETQIGTQWLLYIGVIAIVIGVAYFEKLAIDNQWLGETARVVQGAVLGLLLTYAGLRFVRAGFRVYGQMITGGGGAILYLSTFAAFNFYHLIDRPLAFALMAGITVMVAWLADRQQSQGLALFAVGGGFGTPFLLPGTTDAQIALFGYDAILIGAALLLSRRRDWRLLNIASYVFTVLTVAAWADAFYTPEKYLRTELFLTLFCAMFLYIQAKAPRSLLWTAPATYYIASLLILQDHTTALLVWFVALMLVGGILSDRAGTTAGFTVWLAVAAPLFTWTARHVSPRAGVTAVAAVYLIALAAQLRRTLLETDEAGEPLDLGVADVAWLHLNGLVMFASAYYLVGVTHSALAGPFTAAFALWQGVVAAIVVSRNRDQALHFGALGFTLMSIAIALQFDGPAVTIGWAVEGAVVIALGLRERRGWLRIAGVGLFIVAFGLAMRDLGTRRAIGEAVLFNPHAAAAAVIIALCYVLAWLCYRDKDAPDRAVAMASSLVLAQFVTLALFTSEIHAYWPFREGHLARELMLSVTWGLYATTLIVVGLRRQYAPIRYFAMVVFGITILKVFASDMAELERIYRVSSVIGLGILLLLTSYLYNRSKRA
jgi:uncharacterized membrane protein